MSAGEFKLSQAAAKIVTPKENTSTEYLIKVKSTKRKKQRQGSTNLPSSLSISVEKAFQVLNPLKHHVDVINKLVDNRIAERGFEWRNGFDIWQEKYSTVWKKDFEFERTHKIKEDRKNIMESFKTKEDLMTAVIEFLDDMAELDIKQASVLLGDGIVTSPQPEPDNLVAYEDFFMGPAGGKIFKSNSEEVSMGTRWRVDKFLAKNAKTEEDEGVWMRLCYEFAWTLLDIETHWIRAAAQRLKDIDEMFEIKPEA